MADLYCLQARIRARRAALLPRETYEALLSLPDLRAFAAALRDTPYGRHVDAGAGAASAGAMDEALRRSLAEAFAGLLAASAGEPEEGVRLLLGYWELQAVKTVLRGKNRRLPAEEILPALLPTGIHDEAAIREMARQPDLRAVANLLATWREPLARPLLSALAEHRDPKDLPRLEAALDRFWFDDASRRCRALRGRGPAARGGDALATFVALAADRTNLSTALKAVADRLVPADPDPYFVPGGRIFGRREYRRLLAAESLPEALRIASRAAFARPLAALAAAEAPSLPAVERALDAAILRAARREARRDPLGWGPVAAYVLDRAREVANLRTIIRGRLAGLPVPDIRGLLILEV